MRNHFIYTEEINYNLITATLQYATWNNCRCLVPLDVDTPNVRKYFEDLGYEFAVHRSENTGVNLLMTVNNSKRAALKSGLHG